MMRQRNYALTCGYADGNEAARVAPDPVHKLLAERDPLSGQDLASQSTLSRFVNAVGPKDHYCLGEALVKMVIGGLEVISTRVRPDDLTDRVDPEDKGVTSGHSLPLAAAQGIRASFRSSPRTSPQSLPEH
jgi:Transposase DDE domain group 1